MGNKTLRNSILFSHFFILSFFCQGQESHVDQLDIITDLSEYRSWLVERYTDQMDTIVLILEESISEEMGFIDKIDLYNLLLPYNFNIENYIESIYKYTLKKKVDRSVLDTLHYHYEKTIPLASDIINLAKFNILHHKYPFPIQKKIGFLIELNAYNLDKNDKIADIGSGIGTLGLVLGQLYEGIEIYNTEVDENYLRILEKRKENNVELISEFEYHVVAGSKESTNLEGLNFDKVILRNTFHHFKKKKKMLESIKRSLKPDGELILIESDPTYSNCKKTIPIDRVQYLVELNGYELVKKGEIEHNLFYLNFKIKK